jgi:hypothetical protein
MKKLLLVFVISDKGDRTAFQKYVYCGEIGKMEENAKAFCGGQVSPCLQPARRYTGE